MPIVFCETFKKIHQTVAKDALSHKVINANKQSNLRRTLGGGRKTISYESNFMKLNID